MLHFRRVIYRTVVLAALSSAFFATTNGAAQSDNRAIAPDPQITAALRQVSAQRIQANIEKLGELWHAV